MVTARDYNNEARCVKLYDIFQEYLKRMREERRKEKEERRKKREEKKKAS